MLLGCVRWSLGPRWRCGASFGVLKRTVSSLANQILGVTLTDSSGRGGSPRLVLGELGGGGGGFGEGGGVVPVRESLGQQSVQLLISFPQRDAYR